MTTLLLAASIAVSFTSPPTPVTSFIYMRSFDHSAHWDTRPVWQDSAMSIPLAPGTPRQRMHGYILTQAPARSDLVAFVMACDGTLCSDPSNRVIVATGLVDSLTYFLLRAPGQWTEPRRPKQGTIGWALIPGDSAAFSIVTQASAQAAVMPTVCGWPASLRSAVVCPP